MQLKGLIVLTSSYNNERQKKLIDVKDSISFA